MHVRSKHPGVSSCLKSEDSGEIGQAIAASFDDKSNLIGKFNWVANTCDLQKTPANSKFAPVSWTGPEDTLNSNIPVMMLKIGSYAKLSLFCGDIMARFNYAEQKFVWEIFSGGMLYKMEILFASVTALSLEIPLDGTTILR